MSVGIEPLAAMVLLEIEKAPETTAGGLLLPEEAREKMNVGRVLATGPDAEPCRRATTPVWATPVYTSSPSSFM